MKKKTRMKVLNSSRLAPEIWSLELAYAPEDRPDQVLPGQFAGLYPQRDDLLLMRPISICRWDRDCGVLRFVYRAAGKGTQSFTELQPGDTLDMLGILGNGYDLRPLAGKKVLLLGGGIGVPPMLELAACLRAQDPEADITAVLGYRDSCLFLKEEMEAFANVYVATEDGSAGTRGNVLDAVRGKGIEAEAICACGPLPMLRAVKQYASGQGIPAWLSLEERMACGVGVCLGCVTKTAKVDAHSHVHNARVCIEGPVFSADEVTLQ